VFVGPLQPQKQRARKDAKPAEVDDAAQIAVVVSDVGNGHRIEHSEFFWSNEYALAGGAAQIANGGTENVHFCVFVGAGLGGDLQRVPQRDHGGAGGIVRNKNCGEVLIAGAGPLERTFNGAAAGDVLYREPGNIVGEKNISAAFGGSVVVIIDAGRGVGGRSGFVTEAGGPGGRGENLRSFVYDRGLDVHHVAVVVEVDRFSHREILIGIFEGDLRRRGELAFVRSHVESRTQLGA